MHQDFPLIESYLICPNKENGFIAICSNTLAPGMVLNEIPESLRKYICAIGPLIVNRDGAERMIINCLAHQKLCYLILFGEEAESFKPSSNLLLALMYGFEKGREGNFIRNGIGILPNYPNISEKILNLFRENIAVLPLFKTSDSKIIEKYLEWLKGRIKENIYNFLRKLHTKKKFYFSDLIKLLEILSKEKRERKKVMLSQTEFSSLQPNIIFLEDEKAEKIKVPFCVKREGDEIALYLNLENKEQILIKGKDSFQIAYSLAKFLKEKGCRLKKEEQLLLGAELSRVEMEIKHGIKEEPLVVPACNSEREKIKVLPLENQILLKEDGEYYYTIFLKNNFVCVQANERKTCRNIFELRAKNILPLLKKIAEEDKFQRYEQEALHRMDVGIETTRAWIALKHNKLYVQDFRYLFSENKENFPLFVIDGDNFLANHKKIILSVYAQGLTMEHPDEHKGLMRSSCVLSIFRNPTKALEKLPTIYLPESQTCEEVIKSYTTQLLKKEKGDTSYTYGNRTRAYFGKDQLLEAIEFLSKNPDQPYVIQRFDFVRDASFWEEDGKIKYSHDPCLTHSIYFILSNKLYSFHIARAHNLVNAYPENICGLFYAYDNLIAERLKKEIEAMFVLSSRANILLLTEEQKALKIIREPSKPESFCCEKSMEIVGPFQINPENRFPNRGVGYSVIPLQIKNERPDHPCLDKLENYEGINLIEKAINYLEKKGKAHNNPIIGCYNPKEGRLSEKTRLVFFQANERAGKIHATAVFINGSKEKFGQDLELCNYLASLYSKRLNLPLGNLFFFYVPIKEYGS